MAFEEVLVVPGATPRSADVVSADPITVRWEGADEDEVLPEWPKGCRRVGRGSLNHRILVDRGSVEAALASPKTSVAIVLQLLQDKSRALTVPEIKAALIGDFGLPKELVNKGLNRLPAALSASPNVRVIQEDPGTPGKRKPSTVMPRFEWQAGENDSSPVSQEEARGSSTVQDAPPVLDADSPPAAQQGDVVDPAEGGEAVPAKPDGPLAFLVEGELPDTADLASISVDDVAALLGDLDDKAIAQLRSRLEGAERADLAVLLLATPRPSRPVAAMIRDWPSDPDAQDLLARGLDWLAGASDRQALARALPLFFEKGATPSARVVKFAVRTLPRASADTRPMLLRILAAGDPPSVVGALAGEDAGSLLRLVNREPLATRSRLLWAAMRVGPESIESRDVWGPQLTFRDLMVVSGQTPDSAILVNAWAQDEIVAPIVAMESRSLISRRDVARALDWPRELLALASPQVLAAGMRRAAEQDAVLREFLDSLSGKGEVAHLRELLARADERVTAAEAAERVARDAEQSARDAEQRSFHRAAMAEGNQVAASQGELRQARVDGLRGLVDVLAAAGKLDPDQRIADVMPGMLIAASRHGVSPIGSPGIKVRYDPTRHELLGGEHAEMVEVREQGFEVAEHDGPVLLRRAVVVAVDGHADQGRASDDQPSTAQPGSHPAG